MRRRRRRRRRFTTIVMSCVYLCEIYPYIQLSFSPPHIHENAHKHHLTFKRIEGVEFYVCEFFTKAMQTKKKGFYSYPVCVCVWFACQTKHSNNLSCRDEIFIFLMGFRLFSTRHFLYSFLIEVTHTHTWTNVTLSIYELMLKWIRFFFLYSVVYIKLYFHIGSK